MQSSWMKVRWLLSHPADACASDPRRQVQDTNWQGLASQGCVTPWWVREWSSVRGTETWHQSRGRHFVANKQFSICFHKWRKQASRLMTWVKSVINMFTYICQFSDKTLPAAQRLLGHYALVYWSYCSDQKEIITLRFFLSLMTTVFIISMWESVPTSVTPAHRENALRGLIITTKQQLNQAVLRFTSS